MRIFPINPSSVALKQHSFYHFKQNKELQEEEDHMSKEISKQEKEDYLSLMYEMKRKENQIVKSDLSRELEVPLSRVTRVTDGLLEEGYLLKDEGRRLFLTPMGLSKGQQCLERKRCLTEFLRLVSGVDGSIAKENACAIEHILDERILTGIRMFMENRHTYSYMTRGNDLNLMFPEGKRIMPIAIFEKGTAHPRVLSKEYHQFEKRVEVEISEESYLYLKPKDSLMLEKEIRYKYGNQWMIAKKENGRFGILTEALDCTIRRNDKLSEGVVEILVSDGLEDDILEESVAILTVSLI